MSESHAVQKEVRQAVSDEAYDAAVEAAQLRDIRLISSTFESKPEAFFPPQENWRPSYNCEVDSSFYDEEAELLTGWVSASVMLKVGRRKILSVQAKYLLVYDVVGKPEEGAALKFVGHVGVFAVYPYFRSHFAEITSQAGLKVPPLPVMKEGRRRIRAHLPEAAPE